MPRSLVKLNLLLKRPLKRMIDYLQKVFSNAFYWMNSFYIYILIKISVRSIYMDIIANQPLFIYLSAWHVKCNVYFFYRQRPLHYTACIQANLAIQGALVSATIVLAYCEISNITRTKLQNWNDSHLVLQLFLPNPLKPVIKSIIKMLLEQRRQALLQLHLRYEQCYCLLRCNLY